AAASQPASRCATWSTNRGGFKPALRPEYRARGAAGRAAAGVDGLAVDDRVFDPSRRHHHPLGAPRQIEAALATAGRADRLWIEDGDVGGAADREPAAPLDSEQIGRLRRQPRDRLF